VIVQIAKGPQCRFRRSSFDGKVKHTRQGEAGRADQLCRSAPVVADGPFTETKELIAGFWILQARSKEELIERFSHCPFERGETVEIRQIFEAEDFAGIDEATVNRLARARELQAFTTHP
jgi:hypothetical protein